MKGDLLRVAFFLSAVPCMRNRFIAVADGARQAAFFFLQHRTGLDITFRTQIAGTQHHRQEAARAASF
jgi:hypothetical protein